MVLSGRFVGEINYTRKMIDSFMKDQFYIKESIDRGDYSEVGVMYT